MGNEISPKMLDNLPSILDDLPIKSKGIDLGFGEVGLGLGEVAAGAAGAGLAVGILDGTAKDAIDAIRGKNDRGGDFEFGPLPSGPVAGPDPDLLDIFRDAAKGKQGNGGDIELEPLPLPGPDTFHLSDIFKDAAEESKRQRDDDIKREREEANEREDEEEDEDPDDPEDIPPVEILDPDTDEEDDEEDDQPRRPPDNPPNAPFIPIPKPDPPKPPPPTPEFIVEPISLSLLRAMKRIPSTELETSDIETPEQSLRDKEAYQQYLDGMKADVNNTHLPTLTDHMIRYNGPLRVFNPNLDTTLGMSLNNSVDVWKEYIKLNTIPFSEIYTEALFTSEDPHYQHTNLWPSASQSFGKHQELFTREVIA